MLNCLAVGVGGFFGSISRYLIGIIPIKNKGAFPVSTLLVNVIGALIIGIVITSFSKHSEWDEKYLLMLKVGFCGGFTTFSTFSSEVLHLLETGDLISGVLYIILSIVLCVTAVLFGQLLAG